MAAERTSNAMRVAAHTIRIDAMKKNPPDRYDADRTNPVVTFE
jgi:hypothetical protein